MDDLRNTSSGMLNIDIIVLFTASWRISLTLFSSKIQQIMKPLTKNVLIGLVIVYHVYCPCNLLCCTTNVPDIEITAVYLVLSKAVINLITLDTL